MTIFYAEIRPRMAHLVMPIKQGNLHTIMPLPYEMTDKTSTFYSLTIQMLAALAYLQKRGISHRNIKPTNILVDIRPECQLFQLTDFALTHSPSLADARSNAHVYKAPETYSDNDLPVTTKQDVWSLFVTLAIACGRLSEPELGRKSPVDMAHTITEAGPQLPELETMAERSPAQRASALTLYHRHRPKLTTATGELEYDVLPEEHGWLFAGDHGDEEMEIPLGPNADVSSLTGPLGLPPVAIPAPPGAAPARRTGGSCCCPSPRPPWVREQPDGADASMSDYMPPLIPYTESCCSGYNETLPLSLYGPFTRPPVQTPPTPSYLTLHLYNTPIPASSPLQTTAVQALGWVSPGSGEPATLDFDAYPQNVGWPPHPQNDEWVRPYPLAVDNAADVPPSGPEYDLPHRFLFSRPSDVPFVPAGEENALLDPPPLNLDDASM